MQGVDNRESCGTGAGGIWGFCTSIQCFIKSKIALKSINMFYKRANPTS